jgi:hypothetical protein
MKTAFNYLIQDEYQELQANAEAAIDLFTLAESAEDDLLAELIPFEEYLIARLTRAETDIIIEEYLNRAIQNLYHRITFANSSDTIFTELKESGAAIVEYDHVFLPPDDGQLQTATSDTPNEYKVKTEPRLLMAITALKSLGIYGDDLIIRIGKVDNDMMRKHPYIVLEIPRINKQIILCEQIGNRTFVSHEILDPKHFEILKKSLLRSLDCVTDFVGGKEWSKSLLDHLSDDSDTFKDSKKIPKLVFKEAARKSKPIQLSEAIIKQAAIEWANEHDGKFPTQQSGGITSGILKGENWHSIRQALRAGLRGLPKDTYTGLPDFLEIHGLKVSLFSQSKNLTEDMILEAVKEWAIEHDGKYPNINSGENTSGILKGDSWKYISMALRHGSRGLPKDTYKGLADFLEIHGLKVSLFSQSKNLTEDIILKAVKEWAIEHDGKFPTRDFGEITSGILKGENWKNISMALRAGLRGLPKDTYTGLADFLEIHGMKISLFSQSKNLTEDMILDAMKEWANDHDGKFPTQQSSGITSGILKGETWKNISGCLRLGLRGLPKDTYKGLGDFKTQHNLVDFTEEYQPLLAIGNFIRSLGTPTP